MNSSGSLSAAYWQLCAIPPVLIINDKEKFSATVSVIHVVRKGGGPMCGSLVGISGMRLGIMGCEDSRRGTFGGIS